MKKNIIFLIVTSILVAILFFAYDSDTNSIKLDKISSIFSSEDKIIKKQIEKAYTDFFSAKFNDNSVELPFYNSDLSTSFGALLSPVFGLAAEFKPSDIKVVKYIDNETALVSYNLKVNSKINTNSIEYPIEMIMKKIDNTWLLDSKSFLPSKQNFSNVKSESATKPEMPKVSTFQTAKTEYSFDKEIYEITGKIESQEFLDDASEPPVMVQIPIIKMSNSITVRAAKILEENEEPSSESLDQTDVSIMQLVTETKLKQYYGKNVTLRGYFYGGFNRHHYTDVLFEITEIIVE